MSELTTDFLRRLGIAIDTIENIMKNYIFESNNEKNKKEIIEAVEQTLKHNDLSHLKIEWVEGQIPSVIIKPEIEITFYVKGMMK